MSVDDFGCLGRHPSGKLEKGGQSPYWQASGLRLKMHAALPVHHAQLGLARESIRGAREKDLTHGAEPTVRSEEGGLDRVENGDSLGPQHIGARKEATLLDARPSGRADDAYRLRRRRMRRRLRALSNRSCSPLERKYLRFLSSRSIPDRCIEVWKRLSRLSPSSPSRSVT